MAKKCENKNKYTEFEEPVHTYVFECSDFYVSIKAYDMDHAMSQFYMYFGQRSMCYVKQIKCSDYVTD